MFYAVRKLKDPDSRLRSSLIEAPRPEPGRRWRRLQARPLSPMYWVRDLIWSVLCGGSMVREVGPGHRALERHEFDVREARADWSSRG